MAEETDKPQAEDPQAGSQPQSAGSPPDNLFSQEELDALLVETGQADVVETPSAKDDSEAPATDGAAAESPDAPAASTEQPTAPEGAVDGADGAQVSQGELDALVTQLEQTKNSEQTPTTSEPAGEVGAPAGAASDPDIEAEMAAAIATEMAAEQDAPAAAPADQPPKPALVGSQLNSPPPETATSLGVPDLAEPDGSQSLTNIDLLDDVELDVKIELGRTQMYIEDVLRLADGAVIELDKLAGDPVDIYVNERLVARGEVLVLNESFCVRINDIVSPTAEVKDGV